MRGFKTEQKEQARQVWHKLDKTQLFILLIQVQGQQQLILEKNLSCTKNEQ